VTITLFCSCKRTKVQIQYEQIEKLLGKRIVLPDSIRFVDKSTFKLSESLYDVKTPIKITTNIDGDCHVCIEQLKKWESLIKTNKEALDGVDILFFVRADDYNIFESLVKDLYFPYNFIYDAKGEYLIKNKLPFYNKDYQTFLLNEINEICLVGNPVRNRELAKLYSKVTDLQKIK
jgi:hypothetical protein